jgi:DNA-directed RNA polymerase subunit L
MRLEVLKKLPNELKISIVGEGHTLCNLLETVLLEDTKVEFAAYKIEHPLISEPVMVIRTKKNKKPEKALRDAIEKIIRTEKELSAEFKKALVEWQKKT